MPPDARSVLPGGRTLVSAVAVVSVATALGVLAHRSTPWLAATLVPIIVVSVHLAVVDIEQHRLPNAIVAALALLVTIGLPVAGFVTDDPGRAGRALGLGLAAAGVFLVGHVAGGVGMGDVKYAYPATATVGWFGLDAVTIAAIAMLLTGAGAAGVVVSTGQGADRRVPFGPCMVVGLVAGLVAAGSLAP